MAAAAGNNMCIELIIRILLWLPVASLLRLKSVCKRWCSLLGSSDFVYRHHRFAISKRDNRLISFFSNNWIDSSTRGLYFISVDLSNKNRSISCEPLEYPVIEAPYHFNQVNLVGSCNGVYCLRQDRKLCLWNPATKQSTNLHSLPVLALSCFFAFGFDSETNDHKVLCLDTDKANPTVHLYSLISDSWKRMDSPVSIQSSIHWDIKTPYRNRFYCAWVLNSDSLMLLSFDFSNEVFRTISLPEDSALQRPYGLFILRENIACGNAMSKDGFEIWMLKDFNANEYWTKLYTLPSPFSCPTCSYDSSITTMTGDFLLIPELDTYIYDLVAKEPVINLSVSVHQCLPYEESLVSLKRGNSAVDVDLEFQDLSGIMLNNVSMMGSNSWGDSDISEDVLFLILLWLPVASLLRFMSVCKSWCARIKSSYFVAQYLHLHHHQNVSDNVGLILHTPSPYFCPLFEDSSHPSRNTSCTCLISMDKFELLDLPYNDEWGRDNLSIAASFDGIICLKLRDICSIYLWNPATKQFKLVLEYCGGGKGMDYCIGFGLDVKTNDYKLVKIHAFHTYVCHRTVDIVQVYSLNTDSWRTLDDEIFSTFVRIYNGPTTQCRKGVCCWLAATHEINGPHAILTFDLSQEVFRTIQLPDSIKNKRTHLLKLAVLRDNIACIGIDGDYYFSEVGNWQCEIWIMNELCVEESWTKLYTVGRPFSPSWHVEVAYSKKNKDFLLLENDGQLYTHDLVTQETRRLPFQIQGPEDYQVVLYKESLVPIR